MPKRVLRTMQRGVLGAALRFSQAGTAPRRENRLSARGLPRSGRGDSAKREGGGFRSKIKKYRSLWQQKTPSAFWQKEQSVF